MWLLTIHSSFCPSPVILLLAISGITCAQLTMFPALNTCKQMAAGAFLTCTKIETKSKLPEVSGIVVSGRANQYLRKAPSWFKSLILNSCCSCYGRWPFSMPYHFPRHCFTHTQSFRQFPPCQHRLAVHQHIWNMCSPSEPWSWFFIVELIGSTDITMPRTMM